MEQCRNARAGKTGDPQQSPRTSDNVWCDSHLRKSEVTWAGIDPGSPWWEASSRRSQWFPGRRRDGRVGIPPGEERGLMAASTCVRSYEGSALFTELNSAFTYQGRCDIIKEGRPTPEIAITTTRKKGASTWVRMAPRLAGLTGGLSELRRDVQGVLTSGLCVLCGLERETSSARREIQLLQPNGWYKGPSTPPALSFGNDERGTDGHLMKKNFPWFKEFALRGIISQMLFTIKSIASVKYVHTNHSLDQVHVRVLLESELVITITVSTSLIVTVTTTPDGKTARLARRSDEALVVRGSVARIAPSLLNIERAGLCVQWWSHCQAEGLTDDWGGGGGVSTRGGVFVASIAAHHIPAEAKCCCPHPPPPPRRQAPVGAMPSNTCRPSVWPVICSLRPYQLLSGRAVIVTDDSFGRRAFSGSPAYPTPSFRRCSMFTSNTLIGSQDLAGKSRPNLLTHSSQEAHLVSPAPIAQGEGGRFVVEGSWVRAPAPPRRAFSSLAAIGNKRPEKNDPVAREENRFRRLPDTTDSSPLFVLLSWPAGEKEPRFDRPSALQLRNHEAAEGDKRASCTVFVAGFYSLAGSARREAGLQAAQPCGRRSTSSLSLSTPHVPTPRKHAPGPTTTPSPGGGLAAEAASTQHSRAAALRVIVCHVHNAECPSARGAAPLTARGLSPGDDGEGELAHRMRPHGSATRAE
ncbi:hypothetical protein PR048_019310 [Dryococelus australis]|uniref:Uncharacterized protein n=1 Tax=Dryococelus australis TaxID=614101 RepID=A0ABQ9H386_9NEOP|nr:hypothetical protein PR048_019310 [Dryococelus australis]